MTPSADPSSIESSASSANGAPDSHERSTSGKSAEPNPDASDSSVKTLSAFFNLPRELQVRIVELSCRAYKDTIWRSELDLHDDNALNLLCASRYFHALVTPIFYAHIRATRPSALVSLFKTVAAHPERGSMICSLHLGPDDELDRSHWPLKTREGNLYLRSSLHCHLGTLFYSTRFNDQDLEPKWHYENWEVSLTEAAPHCRGRAIFAALQAAESALDVRPSEPGRGRSGCDIGLASWTLRVFQLRALLELYLIAMRTVDDKHGRDYAHWAANTEPDIAAECSQGSCAHRFPRLTLDKEFVSTHSDAMYGNVNVTPLQVARHLARPHRVARTDQFQHPLLFARSGHPFPDVDVNDQAQTALSDLLQGGALIDGGSHRTEPFIIEDDDEPMPQMVVEAQNGGSPPRFTTPGAGDARDYMREAARPAEATDETIPSGETVGGLLAMARILLLLCPRVDNLSLTGIFHRLLCGRNPIALPSLRCLNIGPVLPYWRTTFTSRGMANLPSLEKLRLCVSTLTNDEVDALTSKTGALGKLKVLQWEAMQSRQAPAVRLCSIPRLASIIHRLQASLEGKVAGLASSTALGKRRRNPFESDHGFPSLSSSATEIGQSVPRRRTPSVEVLIWDIVVDQLLCEDPSLARLIHEEGDPSPCEADESPQLIRLMDSRASNPSKVAPKYSVTEKLYKESRRWWEECAVSCGFRGWGID